MRVETVTPFSARRCTGPTSGCKLPGPPARTRKRGKLGRRLRSAWPELSAGWRPGSLEGMEMTKMIEPSQHAGILTLRLAHGKASALDIELLDALLRELDGA